MKKRTTRIVISFLSVAVIVLAGWAIFLNKQNTDYERFVAASHQHAFSEFVTAVSQMDDALQKSMYATTPSMINAVCTEIFGKSMTAQMSVAALPFSTQELEQVSTFISKVGDYTFALSRNSSASGAYTEEEIGNLKSLSETATTLSQNLKNLEADLNAGVISMDEIIRSESNIDSKAEGETVQLSGSMKLIESEFPEMPVLIYDGPFSDHLSQRVAKVLENQDVVTEEEARAQASAFTGLSKANMQLIGKTENDVPCYYFQSNLEDGEITIKVTERGGYVISVLNSRVFYEGTTTAEQAIETAKQFLEKRGYTDMAESYYILQNNVYTINFAYMQDGVLCYSDLMKVSVASDTGTVCGFESKGYIYNHYIRQLPEVLVSEDEARGLVSPMLTEIDYQLCIIPSLGEKELFCHEFKCESEDGRHYLIYVNAVTGAQEKILILIEDETGALTI